MFWEVRDPTPGTPRNEYRTQHYERMAYANFRFGRNSPMEGWRTDQGRIHILLGEPRTVSRFENSEITYSVIVWFYQLTPALQMPLFLNIAFFRGQAMGEYELYHPVADGALQLLNPSGKDLVRQDQRPRQRFRGAAVLEKDINQRIYGHLRDMSPDLAQAAFSVIPGEASRNPSLRSEIVLGQLLGLAERIMPDATWALKVLAGTTETAVRFEALRVAGRAVGLIDPNGQPFVSYVVSSPGEGMNVGNHEAEYYLTFGLATSMTDANQRVLEQSPTRIVQSALQREQAERVRSGDFYYLDRQPAIPGMVNLDIMFENNVTGSYGRLNFDVEVPGSGPTELRLGVPILCLDARRNAEGYDPFAPQFPFQVGEIAIVPTIDGPFQAGDRLTIFHQVFVPVGRTEPMQLRYLLTNTAGSPLKIQAVTLVPTQASSHGVIDNIATIDLAGVAPGEYRVSIDLEGDAADAVVLPVGVVETVPRPVLHAEAKAPPNDPDLMMIRAAQFRTVGRFDDAIAALRNVLRRVPDKEEALLLLGEMLQAADRHEELEALLAPRLVRMPDDVESLWMLGESSAAQGKHHDAVRYFERARLAGRSDTSLLNALASAYLAADNTEKAVEIMRLSLDLDPDQPAVRSMLDLSTKSRQ